MAIFYYEAVDKLGKIYKDQVEAEGKSEAVLYLQRKNLTPVSLVEESKLRNQINLSAGFLETIKPVDRITLTRNLAVMLKSGLNIVEAVEILIADTNKKLLKNILEHAKASLQRGQPLSATFALYRRHFPVVFTGLLQAGEASGHLDAALEQLGEQMSKEYKLVRKVRSALAYPIILLVASALIVLLLMIFVLPRLAKSFQQSGVELPLLTRIIMGMSHALSSHPVIDLAVVVGFVAAFSNFKKTDFGRRFIIRVALALPLVSDLVKKVALVRFSRNLGTLIGSGLNILDALRLTAETVGNNLYEKKILAAVEEIKNGIPLSSTLKREVKYFPHLLVNMIAVGEKTGTLEYVLKTFSEFYEEEVDNTLKDLTTFLEPLLLLIMGAIIGTIALSILLPIYQLVGKFT